jgi:hypothetical protein
MKYFNIIGRLFLLAGIICCCSFGIMAQTAAKPIGTETTVATKQPVAKGAASLIDTFFKKYKEDGTGPAVDYLFGTNKLFTDTTQIGVLKVKLDALRQSVGAYLGKELIVQKSASASLVFYSILVKHEKSPIRFTFMFYKPKNDWALYRFKFDDQMDSELEEAGKVSNKRAQ